ncbi:hypothetical protein [Planktothrix paucivesiculata]|uniref:Uncharacterized protein n=1 Tax=Planktothrix paucivesiculata PCC 9631 TaxID=671071 RepID=A0A7Z9BNC7_9CYAN|nr:hypothetical protein [Planktothrix paucivesiculata]VXD15562.1 conserved hypothetical protein [Planktothrix paucivesiculata PCC 9631]
MKDKLYPAFLITGTILLTLISLRQFLFRYCMQTERKPAEQMVLSVPHPLSTTFPKTSVAPPPPLNISLPPSSVPTPTNYHQGSFRVSNLTEHPVRVALLSRSAPNITEPVHWDFAPAEGSGEGLILSLPREDLILKSGDILVVFAPDGSRYYWGPYIVGETPLPAWNSQDQEWELVIKPTP